MEVNQLKGLYIAHRGIQNGKTIENTIPAFSLALEKKVPIEFDIHILRDGKLVVYHDDTLKRLLNIDKKISDYSYEELKKLTFLNTELHIPSFQEVLEFVRGKVLLVIEIKKSDCISYQKYCEKVFSVLKDYRGDFVVKSFDIRIVHWFLKHTNYVTGLLIANRKGSVYDYLMQRRLTLTILKPHFISVDYHIAESSVVQDFRKKGPVLAWTIKDNLILEKIKDRVDGYLIQEFYF